MAELLLDHGDLIVEESVPACISAFLAHVASYEILLQAWERDESSDLLAAVDYPPAFTTYVEDSYRALKQRQVRLIGSFDAVMSRRQLSENRPGRSR
jgi:hypothetical protein